MSTHVINEAKRCLNCKTPLCRTGCPINTPIPDMIRTLLEGDLTGAGKMLLDNNPLSVICSLVCNHEKQCEGHCVLGKKGTPVQISTIENYVSSAYLDKTHFTPAPRKGQRAAIIGSGPAGITISILLAQRGYDVTIFEANDQIGGVLRYGIPAFRLPKDLLDKYKERLEELGILIRPNTSIGAVLNIDDLVRDGYEAIFIGTGVWKPNSLGIKGESLGNVHYALDYLKNPDVYQLGKRVAVIGAGNSAMDVARTAVRKGAQEVTVYLRSDRISASQLEVDYAKLEGVHFAPCHVPVEITPEGPIFKLVEMDENNKAVDIPDSAALIPADSTIISISQGPRNAIVSTTTGIDTSQRGLVVTDDCGRTTRPGIFASGDVVNGARTVVEAVSYSKRVADAMDQYMSTGRTDCDQPEESPQDEENESPQ